VLPRFALVVFLALAACGRTPPQPVPAASTAQASSSTAPASASPASPAPASPPLPQDPAELTRALYSELIAIDTSPEHGTTRAVEAMAAHLRAERFPGEVHVVGPNDSRMNLVVRLRGTGKKKPLLLLAHLDVIEARREDWSLDPFTLTEKDGYFYGRGSLDDKAMASIWLATVIRLAREGYVPNRDVIVALTADEEQGDENGVVWLLEHEHALIDAAYALNEGGGGDIRNGRYMANLVQLAEKLEQSFELTTSDKGGDSAQPRKDNSIYRLAAALSRVGAFDFPLRPNDVTRGYFASLAKVEPPGPLADAMRAIGAGKSDARALERVAAASTWYSAMLRTTCVATLVEAGEAESALPQTSRATLNCRILPGETVIDVEATLAKVIADSSVKLTRKWEGAPSPPSPPNPELMAPVERLTKEMWPGVVVAVSMLPAATDGKFLRAAGIATYGVSGLFEDVDDVREHGRDERIGIKQFHDGRDFMYRLVRLLTID
jgi:acetylornithine deacetylase/succinyl-diaminopimelate desuccinylase-like protein